MSKDEQRLKHWWTSLSHEERSEAKRAAHDDRLTPAVQESLKAAKLEDIATATVIEFLKMRHD